jgi:hypothetical protein
MCHSPCLAFPSCFPTSRQHKHTSDLHLKMLCGRQGNNIFTIQPNGAIRRNERLLSLCQWFINYNDFFFLFHTSLEISRCFSAKCIAWSWFPRAVYAFPKLQHALPSPILKHSSKLYAVIWKVVCAENKMLAVVKDINHALDLFDPS